MSVHSPQNPRIVKAEVIAEDLNERVSYLKEFIGFGQEDIDALHAAAPVVDPLVPTIVDAVYVKLFSFTITKQSFLPRQTGYDGPTPTSASDLTLDHDQIRFRKDFLSRYLRKLVTDKSYGPEFWKYLDNVGLMHTGQPGFKHREKKPALRVDLIHCTILLGYVVDMLLSVVVPHPDLDNATKTAVLRAVNKVVWIQNDLFGRHYVKEEGGMERNMVVAKQRTLQDKVSDVALMEGTAWVVFGVIVAVMGWTLHRLFTGQVAWLP